MIQAAEVSKDEFFFKSGEEMATAFPAMTGKKLLSTL